MIPITYRNVLLPVSFTIGTGQNYSNVIDCGVTSIGASNLMRLTFPTDWTTSTCQILCCETLTSTGNEINLSDGINPVEKFIISGANPNTTVPLLPYWCNAMQYLQLYSVNTQLRAVTITGWLQPLYQAGN